MKKAKKQVPRRYSVDRKVGIYSSLRTVAPTPTACTERKCIFRMRPVISNSTDSTRENTKNKSA